MRYGIPWYLVDPERGRFAWSWLDRVVDKLEELGIEAIVDLMHYGTPLWLDNQFLNESYPEAVAEYASRGRRPVPRPAHRAYASERASRQRDLLRRGRPLAAALPSSSPRRARPAPSPTGSPGSTPPSRRCSTSATTASTSSATRGGSSSTLVDWDYREGIKPAGEYLVQMGMHDLRRDDIGRLERTHTPLVDRFRLPRRGSRPRLMTPREAESRHDVLTGEWIGIAGSRHNRSNLPATGEPGSGTLTNPFEPEHAAERRRGA